MNPAALTSTDESRMVSQEVLARVSSTCRYCPLIFRNRGEDAELRIQVFADVHNGSNVTTAVAVIRSRPNSDHGLLREVILVAFIDKLVSTCDEFQAIDMVELGCDLVTEEPASATRRNSPSVDVLGVTPDKITEGTLMRNLLSTSNDADLINSADFRAESSVNAEDLTINDSSKDEEVENLAAGLPDRRVAVLLLTLLVETVDLSNLAGFVVTSDEGDLIRVHCLKAHQQGECLQAEVATIDEITKEDEVLAAATRDLVDADC